MQVRQFLWTGGFFLTLDFYKTLCKSQISNNLACDVIAGFAAGATGTALNCWTDVCRSVVQKKALADTFDAAIPRPSVLTVYSPGPFVAEARNIFAAKGLGG